MINQCIESLYRHIDNIIFEQDEIRSLQSVLHDYKAIVSEHGYPVGNIKSSYMKELLIAEYKDEIGFKERHIKKLSEWVYDTRGGGDYIQCVVNSLGITDEQLVKNVVPRIVKQIKDAPELPWPPTLEELEEGDEISPLLLMLLTWMKQPNKKL